MRLLFLMAFVILISACAGPQVAVEKHSVPEKTKMPAKYDESFDPTTLNDEDIHIPLENDQPIKQETVNQPMQNNQSATDLVKKEINGFRVQILATRDFERATVVEELAREQFLSHNQNTYHIFETPLYKIRIGDCKDRKQAEELRDLANELGYKEAFIVRTKVQVFE